MEAILLALNSDVPMRRLEMRRLVEAWEDAGRNVETMLNASTELSKELRPYIFGNGAPSWRAMPILAGSGLTAMPLPEAPQKAMTKDEFLKDEPRLMFLHLLLNPLRDELCNRPCARCGKYFIKRRSNQKSYCGRKCGTRASAKSSTRKRLDTERERKLFAACRLISQWDALSRYPKLSWKQWVQKRNPEITAKWLTRAVNHYGLKEPAHANT
jgi:hypothetical protein